MLVFEGLLCYATQRNIDAEYMLCSFALDTLLHVVTICCTNFETGQIFEPTTPNIQGNLNALKKLFRLSRVLLDL